VKPNTEILHLAITPMVPKIGLNLIYITIDTRIREEMNHIWLILVRHDISITTLHTIN